MIATVYRRVCDAEAWIASAFLVLMVVLIFSGGIARLIGYPLNWTGDAATAFFAWACFLCADIAWRRNSLMAIEVLTSRLAPLGQKLLRHANHLMICSFLLYVFVMGVHLSWISRARSFQGIPEISYSWVTMSMPVGALLLLVTTVLKIRDDWRGAPPPASAATDIL
ncbi:MAG: TRAP transporter small permease subunit [Pseudomonadota bacterium]